MFLGRYRYAPVVILSGVCVIAIMAQTYLLFTNSLERNGHWRVTKKALEIPLMGSGVFEQGLQALSKGRLDLSAWHGFQEVLFRETLSLSQASFACFLDAEAYACFIFDKNPETFSGIRLSTHPEYPPIFFIAQSAGRFVERIPLPDAAVRAGRWNTVLVRFEGGRLILSVNGTRIDTHAIPEVSGTTAGFRGGFRRALIDDVYLWDPGKATPWKETFSNHRNRLSAYGVAALALIFIDVLLGVGQWLLKGWGRSLSLSIITLHVALLLPGVLAYGYIYGLYSPRYPTVQALADQRPRWFDRYVQWSRDNLEKEKARLNTSAQRRVLFIGSSQTYGQGATVLQEGFVPRTEALLNARSPEIPSVCLNAAVIGSDSSFLFPWYRDEWLACGPQITVINLSHNDQRPEVFAQNLAQFAQLDRSKGIETLFVLEAASPEAYPQGLPMHSVMRATGGEQHVRVIDLYEALRRHSDEGFLWWDRVHPTSFGHALIAARLTQEILAMEGGGL